ncbi:MAG: tRNA uridine-5-carboxymethylaminomethyl(34) synthesis GTPase MnmE [Gammaproteobacteria bacterium CG11_big_fil_rev_8_21_14_0_20_46_22]|nr:MAG: tRNA uridine-5-carboxymethylaminomethyl(34) synthesis GTPase MnmE [Gammaproteobacteria bacterium CG12_big_fil_rev_8_21_14_0_65_46_12]PIR10992.1 MAG: tRNA uridine-5-carboxymethylaminomethyl(34) synthesis GTPase MnmE [Gammaproteobacteria bacterium CG11_big_fil_rev_8_21_14_0_20_46_22]
MVQPTDTIIAIATPPGHGGVGIVRVSGPHALECAKKLSKKTDIQPRKVVFTEFFDEDDQIIDQGLSLFFQSPRSFTGEDVVEFQAHGGPIILDSIIKTCLSLNNVRLAKPGEFTERAFLNNKIDLVQAEAIADLINASTKQAAQSAIQSLQGTFSKAINELLEKLIQLRLYVEAAIDFPEEEIDFINDGKIASALNNLKHQFNAIYASAKQGHLLQEGMKVAIVGHPNAGKSSLLNALSGRDTAIVTDIAGTTRDIIRESINIDGMPLHIIDTAGLRKTTDSIEKMGIDRAWQAMDEADVILVLLDGSKETLEDLEQNWPELIQQKQHKKFCVVVNKIDLMNQTARIEKNETYDVVFISAKLQQGLEHLKTHLKSLMNYQSDSEGLFIARRRHIDALEKTDKHLKLADTALNNHQAGEIVAEELRLAQNHLNEITGEFTSDDLLGKIFSTFCIGK